MREFLRDYWLETVTLVGIVSLLVAVGAAIWSETQWERRATAACGKAGGMLVRNPHFVCAKVEPVVWSVE